MRGLYHSRMYEGTTVASYYGNESKAPRVPYPQLPRLVFVTASQQWYENIQKWTNPKREVTFIIITISNILVYYELVFLTS